MPRFDAPSISMTSKLVAWAISLQAGHAPQGETVGPSLQLSDFARILAQDVLPTPRGPQKRYAWARRLALRDSFRSVVICSCPRSSSNFWGRYFLAKTIEDMISVWWILSAGLHNFLIRVAILFSQIHCSSNTKTFQLKALNFGFTQKI